MFTREDPAPRQRRLASYSWPNLILLPALIGAVHATTYSLLIFLFLDRAFGFSGGRPAPWPGAIALIWLASFWTTRVIDRRSLSGRTAQAVSLVCWLATLLVWFAAEPVYREARIWSDPGSLVQGNAYLIPPLLIAMITWWQGIRYAAEQPSLTAEDTRGTVQRAWLVLGGSIVLAIFIGGDTGGLAMRAARISVPLLLIFSLAVVAGAELETTRRIAVRRGGNPPGWDRWFRLVSGLSTFVVIITIGVLALLGPQVLSAVVELMFAVLRVVGTAVGYVIYAVFFTLYQIILGFVWLLEELFGDIFGPLQQPDVPVLNPAIGEELFPEQQGTTEQWKYAILLRWVALGLLLIALAIVLFKITRRSSPAADAGIVDEQRDSIFSADLARQQLRDLFRRRQREGQHRPLDLNGEPVDVRDIMRYLETLAVRQGVGRKAAETSSDFLERLRAVWTGVSPSLLDFNGRYQRIRYGDHPDTREGPEYGPSLKDWTEVWSRRKDVEIEPAAKESGRKHGKGSRMMISPARFTVPVAVHLFLIRDESILLLRRFNTGYEDGNYSVIAGHLDGREEVLAAMSREAREEAGINLVNAEVAGVMHRHAGDGERIDFFVVCHEWTGAVVNQEPEKCDELRWVPIDALPPNTIPYVAAAIDAWRAGIWFTSFGWDAWGVFANGSDRRCVETDIRGPRVMGGDSNNGSRTSARG